MPLLTSIHGRAFGLDENLATVNNQKRTGTKVAGTSDSTGTTLANNGFVSVTSTTNDGWVLDNPYQGALVTLFINSTSTGVHSISLNNSVGYTTVGTEGSTVTLSGPGASITLYGLSTGAWLPVARSGSSGSAYISS